MFVFFLVLAQSFYTLGDLLKKIAFGRLGFKPAIMADPLFLVGLLVPVLGFIIQMYVFSRYELSRTMIVLGTLTVIFSAAAGVLYLKERLNPLNYLGLLFAVLAIVLTNVRK